MNPRPEFKVCCVFIRDLMNYSIPRNGSSDSGVHRSLAYRCNLQALSPIRFLEQRMLHYAWLPKYITLFNSEEDCPQASYPNDVKSSNFERISQYAVHTRSSTLHCLPCEKQSTTRWRCFQSDEFAYLLYQRQRMRRLSPKRHSASHCQHLLVQRKTAFISRMIPLLRDSSFSASPLCNTVSYHSSRHSTEPKKKD